MISKEIVSREYISYCPTESKWTWFSKAAVHKFIWKHHRPVRLLKYTPAQILSSKFCEIFKDSFFKEHLRMTASDNSYFWTCFITAFERDEYHKFCRWKIILCEIKEVALNRSSRPEAFCKKNVLENFAKFTGKHMCQILFFNKIACLKRLWHRCFSVNFVKFLRRSFSTEQLRWLPLLSQAFI